MKTMSFSQEYSSSNAIEGILVFMVIDKINEVETINK